MCLLDNTDKYKCGLGIKEQETRGLSTQYQERKYREGIKKVLGYTGVTIELHRSNIGITQVYVRYNSGICQV
jgi:hypothetical protein